MAGLRSMAVEVFVVAENTLLDREDGGEGEREISAARLTESEGTVQRAGGWLRIMVAQLVVPFKHDGEIERE